MYQVPGITCTRSLSHAHFAGEETEKRLKRPLPVTRRCGASRQHLHPACCSERSLALGFSLP